MATNPLTDARAARIGKALPSLALVVGVACGAAALLAGPAYRFGLLPLGAGIATIRWAATFALAGAVVAVVAIVMLLVAGGARRGVLVAALALAINLAVAGPPLYLYREVERLPRIHDISTDTDRPPQFVAVVPLRRNAPNALDYDPGVAAQQTRAYPDIVPLVLDIAAAQAFERARRAAAALRWEIVAVAPEDLRIEATDTTLLFGFKDDVVIRVTGQGQRSVVDVRSVSRVGRSDVGANARRIRAFLRQLASG